MTGFWLPSLHSVTFNFCSKIIHFQMHFSALTLDKCLAETVMDFKMILNYNHSLKYQHYSQQKSHRHQMSGNSTAHTTLTKAGRYWLITVNGIETNIQFIIHSLPAWNYGIPDRSFGLHSTSDFTRVRNLMLLICTISNMYNFKIMLRISKAFCLVRHG